MDGLQDPQKMVNDQFEEDGQAITNIGDNQLKPS